MPLLNDDLSLWELPTAGTTLIFTNTLACPAFGTERFISIDDKATLNAVNY